MTTNTPAFPLRRVALYALPALALLAGGALLRVWAQTRHDQALSAIATRDAPRSVAVDSPRLADAQRTLILPGSLRGRHETDLHARTSGYVASWHRDIGDRVRKGDLLAVIDTPEIAQQLAQARANAASLAARVELAQASVGRWRSLAHKRAVPAQEIDERQAALGQAQADLAAAQANVRRLQQLQDFRQISAPFDGVVVRRQAEVGALVGGGDTARSAALFRIAQTDVLSVSVAVPQNAADAVRHGQTQASVRLGERPGASWPATLTRSSGAFDPATRALAVDLELPNADGALVPGAYVEVVLTLTDPAPRLLVPANALQFRSEGPRVAVVDGDARIRWQVLKLGRDFGRSVEVLDGVAVTDRIVLSPADTLQPGERVIAVAAPAPAPSAPSRVARAN